MFVRLFASVHVFRSVFNSIFLCTYECMYVDIPQAPLDLFRGLQISDVGDSDLGVVDRTRCIPV
jgi:hypothetical protein